MRPLLLALLALLVATAPATAQRPHTPAPGTAERRAILDATRARVRAEFDPATRVLLLVNALRVFDDWADLSFRPLAPGGALLPEYEAACMCDCYASALLRRERSAWTVVEFASSPCDPQDTAWMALHGVPPAVFGMTASPAPARGPARVLAPSPDDPWLELRSEPSMEDGVLLGTMPEGARVEVLSCRDPEYFVQGGVLGHWCRVRFEAQEGWAFDLYLTAPD